MAPKSLIHASRERYLNTIRSVQPASRWKIIVVDAYTRTHLNALLKLDAILRESVTVVELIESQRAAQPNYEAAYLLCPTSDNVERIIRDLTPGRDGTTQYAAAHVFFVDALSDALLQRITSSPAEPRLRQLIELYNNFWPTESQAFSLKTPQSFFTLFQPPGGAWGLDAHEAMQAIEDELQFTVQQLLNVCVTLNEFPLIRYYNPSHPPLGPLTPPPGSSAASAAPAAGAAAGLYAGSMRMARLRGAESGNGAIPAPSSAAATGGEHFTRKLALRLQTAIDVYVRDNQPKPDVGRPRGVMFITDRTMDTVAPFLHEFSYQAMINDLLPLEEDGTRYHYKFTNSDGEREAKVASLSDDDAVWRAIRHLHIAEAIERLTRDFAEHAGSAGHFAGASSLHDMRDMLASLPELQETKEALSLHLTMAQECMNVFEKTRLPQQAMVEQNCATRTTPEGQKPRTLVEDMVPLLDDRTISNADKVRIIALYIMYSEGVPDEDRRRLFQHAKLGLHEMSAVDNLVHLGARVVKDPQNSGWDAWFKKGKRRQAPGENEYELSRYQPLVKLMIEDHFAGKLDQTTYPYVRDAPPDTTTTSLGAGLSLRDSAMSIARANSPAAGTTARAGAPSSLRSAKPTWHQKGRPGAAGAAAGSERNDTRQRVIVFVAGGATYSEIRSAYQCTEKLGRDVYIGSSHLITPEGFIESLKRFGKAGGAGASAGAGAGASGRTGHHATHSAHLPSGASHFSKPDNDKSVIRTQAARARDGGRHDYGDQPHAHHHQQQHEQHQHGQHGHGQGQYGNGAASSGPTYQPDQSSYDRRFRSTAPPSQADAYSLASSSSQQQQQRPPQGRPGGGGPQSYGPSSSAQILQGTGEGRQSPAPSAMSAQSDGRVAKEKKKLKNPFSFKKS